MALPDLDDLIAEVDRTCDAAGNAHGGEPDQPNWPALLAVAARLAGELQALADDLVEDYVEHCRMHGHSWTEIGSVLGVTRQAAQQRFLAPHRRYSPEEFTEELRQAMTRVKQVAVRHRNNYIGTEHLLWGLIGDDNDATRLLEALHVSVGDLRRTLEARLSMGASQAAERIAFTPYSRKAMAIAEEAAARQGSAGIGCDHLLAGLVGVGRGVAAAVLNEAGVDRRALDGFPRRP
ncbi:MAG TPA: Clp protease N-terminal domain-containing protein [Streptosporangiaceae bacterium]|nr:Clp protease N-terminal domain-containing protein [Streptosporangiaceae bacterium]